MTQTRKRPIRTRTCIATRSALPDTQLLRVVADPDVPGRVLADPARKLPGRGAWIIPTMDAFELAEQRRAFGRALRLSTAVDLGHVREYLQNASARPRRTKEDRTLMSTQP
ncbi:YlxR family protein [Corynebacterium sp. Marseille-P4321]|uniref:YlxR family protein n=1 Tax=Corynebacterium sp. Marseille-P4321 TaxID=2736603 RepID=UPI0009E64D94|nr:YlxR family protein [Corynebacterium sp. Marseille-P4321]